MDMGRTQYNKRYRYPQAVARLPPRLARHGRLAVPQVDCPSESSQYSSLRLTTNQCEVYAKVSVRGE